MSAIKIRFNIFHIYIYIPTCFNLILIREKIRFVNLYSDIYIRHSKKISNRLVNVVDRTVLSRSGIYSTQFFRSAITAHEDEIVLARLVAQFQRGLEIRCGSRDGPGTRLTEISRVVGQIMVFNPLLGIALCFHANSSPKRLLETIVFPPLKYFASRHV